MRYPYRFFLGFWVYVLVALSTWPAWAVSPPTIAMGFAHSLALKADGTLVAWGDDSLGQLGAGRALSFSTPQVVPNLNLGANPAPDMLAAGTRHALARLSGDVLWAWGNNDGGQLGDGTLSGRSNPSPVKDLGPVLAMAGGLWHSLALKADGTVWAWGRNDNGQLGVGVFDAMVHVAPAQVQELSQITAVVAYSHNLALKTDGTVWAWGRNDYGQLGDGTTIQRSIPIQVMGLSHVIAVAVGRQHSLALAQDGTVWAWGYNFYGQLGDGSTTDRSIPAPVQGLHDVKEIAGGGFHSLALKADGTVLTWGYNANGQLGDGTHADRSVPVPISGLEPMRAIAGGKVYSLALAQDGTVWAWGCNGDGQLGNGTTTDQSTPTLVPGLSSVRILAAGDSSSIAVTSDGAFWAWGNNSSGQLGVTTVTNHSIPIQVQNLDRIRAIAGGVYHNLALRQDGTVWAWGNNFNGQIGDRRVSASSFPVPVTLDGAAAAVAAGSSHSLSVTQDGRVWAWGGNNFGQLGLGTADIFIHDFPVQVMGINHVTAVAAGFWHNLALTADGTVWSWGLNSNGQLGDGTTTDRYTPIRVLGLEDVAAIMAGGHHSLALKADGTLWVWGSNTKGQIGNGAAVQQQVIPVQVTPLSHVTAAAAGNFHSLAITREGTAWVWGSNANGQLGLEVADTHAHPIPTPLSELTQGVAVAAGWRSSMVVRQDGTVWAFGDNSSGQLGNGTYASHYRLALVENETLDGVLDLDPAIPNQIPGNALPPFLVKAEKEGNLAALGLSVDIRSLLGTLHKSRSAVVSYNVYIAGVLPPNDQQTLYEMLPDHSVVPWIFSSPMQGFLYNIGLETQYDKVRLDILKNADLSSVIGASIYVGYGIDSEEMIANNRFRKIFEVQQPTNTND